MYLFIFESETAQAGKKKRDTDSKAGFRLQTVFAEANAGLEPTRL